MLIVFLHAIQVTEAMAIIQNLENGRVSHSHIMGAVIHTSTYTPCAQSQTNLVCEKTLKRIRNKCNCKVIAWGIQRTNCAQWNANRDNNEIWTKNRCFSFGIGSIIFLLFFYEFTFTNIVSTMWFIWWFLCDKQKTIEINYKLFKPILNNYSAQLFVIGNHEINFVWE